MPSNLMSNESKPSAMFAFNADHLFVDGDGVILDSHIENLFDDLFYDKPLDAIFQNNFRQYYGMLTGFTDEVPDYVFDNVTKSRQWIEHRFGRMEITMPEPHADPDLAHCKYRAVFREPARYSIDPIRAPTALTVQLLCAVTVFRSLAQRFNDERFLAKPGELN